MQRSVFNLCIFYSSFSLPLHLHLPIFFNSLFLGCYLLKLAWSTYSILFYFWSLHLLHPFISISSPSISHQNKLYCPFTLPSLIILYLPLHLYCLFIFLISSARYCFIIKQLLTIESMNIIMSPPKGGGHIVFGADPVGVGVSFGVSTFLFARYGMNIIISPPKGRGTYCFWCGSCWR